ncbi:MAG: adenylosuccinate lyase [Coxiella sp. RIFCSPHIGHO2_12_FULL_42_15]|nr:MAG: adenylosuccinate lyase [Coxiella sp. RIFCSPHIGHO2_12_FULL_42_15]
MEFSEITAISPLDGRYGNKLHDLRTLVSEYGLIYFRVEVEVRWLMHLAAIPEIKEVPALTEKQQQFFTTFLSTFNYADAEHIKNIELTTNHDVKAIEYFICEKIFAEKDLQHLIPFIHFGCTSEDVNNLSYALMLKKARQDCLLPMLTHITNHLKNQAHEYSTLAMLGRTHGQSATPTTLGKEFANVVARLHRQIRQLKQQQLLGKFNGAVGNYNAHCVAYPEIDWPRVCEHFVQSLGLTFNPFTTQIEPHDFIAEFLQNLTRINTILLDLSRDCWSYISIGYFQQKSLTHEVGSSTMPHKVNPIDFENAEGNLGIANALGEHLALKLPISRWQRDLSDSTTLRNMGSILGYSVLAYHALQKGLAKISANTDAIQQDLQDRWEVLAEAIQMVMRRYGINDAYEQLKTLTRGKTITQALISQFITELNIPKEAKQALLQLNPTRYVGYAVSLSEKIGNNN